MLPRAGLLHARLMTTAKTAFITAPECAAAGCARIKPVSTIDLLANLVVIQAQLMASTLITMKPALVPATPNCFAIRSHELAKPRRVLGATALQVPRVSPEDALTPT